MLEVPDVDFIRPCGVVVFAMFYCRLDLCCGECHVGCPQLECLPINVSVCFVCTVSDCVGVVTVFPLKVTLLPLGCLGVLLANPCIVFQRKEKKLSDRGITCVLCSDVVSVFNFVSYVFWK